MEYFPSNRYYKIIEVAFFSNGKLSTSKLYKYFVSKDVFEQQIAPYAPQVKDPKTMALFTIMNREGFRYNGSSVVIHSIMDVNSTSIENLPCSVDSMKFLAKLTYQKQLYLTPEQYRSLSMTRSYSFRDPGSNNFTTAIKGSTFAIEDLKRAIGGLQTGGLIPDKTISSFGSNLPIKTISGDLLGEGDTITLNIKKEGNTMFDKMFKDFRIGRVIGDAKMSALGIAFRSNDGKYFAYDPKASSFVDATDLLIDGFDSFIYSIPVAKKDVKAGDYIYHGSSIVRVVEVGSAVTADNFMTRERVTIIPTRNIFGFDFYSKVISMADGFLGTVGEDSPFGNLLPFMMMKDGDNDMMSTMMMMSMMKGAPMGDFAKNPMMLMMLMGKGSGNDDMMKMMLLSSMTNGNIFGGLGATAKTTAE